MKAEIVEIGYKQFYQWKICYNNGAVATKGPFYTRQDNAVCGLKKFCINMVCGYIYLNGEELT